MSLGVGLEHGQPISGFVRCQALYPRLAQRPTHAHRLRFLSVESLLLPTHGHKIELRRSADADLASRALQDNPYGVRRSWKNCVDDAERRPRRIGESQPLAMATRWPPPRRRSDRERQHAPVTPRRHADGCGQNQNIPCLDSGNQSPYNCGRRQPAWSQCQTIGSPARRRIRTETDEYAVETRPPRKRRISLDLKAAV
jgi:hypothetical protein